MALAWHRFRAQPARTVTGAVTTTGLGKFYDETDPGATTPVPIRRTVDANGVPTALGAGPVIENIAVASAVAEDFDAYTTTPGGYWKSGSAPAVFMLSATGALADVTAARADVDAAIADADAAAASAATSASSAATAAADAAAARAAAEALPGSGHFVLATESTSVPTGLPEDTLIVVLEA